MISWCFPLQGPAPYKDKNNTLPFVTMYHSNFDNKSLVTNIRRKINHSNSAYLKEVTKYSNIVYNNPKTYWDWLLMQIITQNNKNGLFKFTDKLCKICKIYVNECSFFTWSDDINWQIQKLLVQLLMLYII